MKKLILLLVFFWCLQFTQAQVTAVIYGSGSDVYTTNFIKTLQSKGVICSFCDVMNTNTSCNNEMIAVVEKYHLWWGTGNMFMPVVKITAGGTSYGFCVPCEGPYFNRIFTVTSAEVNDLPGLKVYPSPANDMLYITGTTAPVEIYSLSGYKMLVTGDHEIDVSGLKPGMYVVKVEDRFRKFVKK